MFCRGDGDIFCLGGGYRRAESRAHSHSLRLGLFGAAFALVGGVSLFKERKKRERARAARKNGCPVPCLVTAVYPDMSLIVNGKFPCNLLECSPLRGGAVYVSAPFSAKERVELLSEITVYADDDGGYFVDLGSIKPPASGVGKAAGTEQG